MIIYATKETMQRYKLKTPDQLVPEVAPFAKTVVERDQGNRLYEWGCKLFYFDRRKCLQFMHFETKFVVFLVDIKLKEMKHAFSFLAQFLMELYSADPIMLRALERYFESSPFVVIDKIRDRSIIASMNNIQTRWAMDGNLFYRYIRDGILHTKQINRDVNNYPVGRIVDGQKKFFFPCQRFEQVIKENFS